MPFGATSRPLIFRVDLSIFNDDDLAFRPPIFLIFWRFSGTRVMLRNAGLSFPSPCRRQQYTYTPLSSADCPFVRYVGIICGA
jgi:hypothetical protein